MLHLLDAEGTTLARAEYDGPTWMPDNPDAEPQLVTRRPLADPGEAETLERLPLPHDPVWLFLDPGFKQGRMSTVSRWVPLTRHCQNLQASPC
ncbi:hypothetical protein [Streptomyces cuspidosporus]|uniref:Uncharacterized protein n=1 Tax=Streptomyces cuspidosporus TaxID=66882 RepID=A0ABP5SHF5_9ACTN